MLSVTEKEPECHINDHLNGQINFSSIFFLLWMVAVVVVEYCSRLKGKSELNPTTVVKYGSKREVKGQTLGKRGGCYKNKMFASNNRCWDQESVL